MFQKKKMYLLAAASLLCLSLTACGEKKISEPEEEIETPSISQDHEEQEEQENTSPQETVPDTQEDSAPTAQSDKYPRGALIEDQTFTTLLRPLGEITFASYEPDTSENPLSDVVFLIEKDDTILTNLPGVTEENIAPEAFAKIEAISFTDYNYDNYDDIIMVLDYYLGAGPQAATPHSLIRYYTGSAEGTFTYEAETSEAATSALAEHTIQTAKNFVSGKRVDDPGERESVLTPWQEAYLTYLTNDTDPEAQKGYTLINLTDDNVPQIAEIGIDAATGSRIIHYANGEAHITQLNRLYFTYIPRENLLCNSEGNMDHYYDLIYRLKDGEMTLVSSGYYGAEDNSRIQLDENGDPIYQYEWNGISMTQKEYEQEFSQFYDQSKAKTYDYDNIYTLEELQTAIETYQ